MFGNTLGWIISAVMTAVAAFGTYLLVVAGVPTPPTGLVETALKPLTLATAAESVIPQATDSKAEAGALYREAIADYESHPEAYDSLQHNSNYASAKAEAASLKGLDKLLQASTARCIGIFTGEPKRIINFDANPADLDAIDGLSKTAGMITALAKLEKDYRTARDYGNAVLVLGVRLYQERLAYLELAKGETLIGLGTDILSGVADAEHSSGAGILAFKQQYRDDSEQVIQKMAKVLFDISDAGISAHAGDMFAMATDPKVDRVWRVEAIHRLGRLQKNAGNRADQIKAARVLAELSADPKEDSIIHLIADQSLNMSEGDYQSQR